MWPSPPLPPLPSGEPVQVGKAYGLLLNTHCGLLPFDFGGRTWFADAPASATGAVRLPNPIDAGTIVLTGSHRAIFTDVGGASVYFVDHPPASTGTPYGVELEVRTDGHIDGMTFAGQSNWVTDSHYPGPVPSPGDPASDVVMVGATATLDPNGQATVQLIDGRVLAFHLVTMGCA